MDGTPNVSIFADSTPPVGPARAEPRQPSPLVSDRIDVAPMPAVDNVASCESSVRSIYRDLDAGVEHGKPRSPARHAVLVLTTPGAAPTTAPSSLVSTPAATPAPAINVGPALAPPVSDVSPEHERDILAVLDAPATIGEAAASLFRRKEHELRTVFARLSVPESHALDKRLSSPNADDAIAARFSRLVVERRSRLIAFLADARRREAISMARRCPTAASITSKGSSS